ncbi:MAG: hypothetical protein JWM80_5816 [Cyanobacteria bacterium RYN_339]|nr:hypothetical protein [Cyanobacteria bacterium RYN_339]
MRPWFPALVALTALASGCGLFQPPVPVPFPVTVVSLPGGLNATPVFNSDRPETVSSGGVLLDSEGLGYRLDGHFGLFSHHVGHMPVGDPGPLHLALLATNHGTEPLTLERLSGASWTTRPDAPYLDLDTLLADPTGSIYAGPGDRVAVDWLHGKATAAGRWTIAPGATVVVSRTAMPVSVRGTAAANGRSTMAEFDASGELSLAEVAAFGNPSDDAFRNLLAAGTPAGPTDVVATRIDPKPVGALRYGRVCGISEGDVWTGQLETLPDVGQCIGYPIASLYANRMGTGQIQSARILARTEGSAFQAHGNYGVTYELGMHLPGPGTYALTFASPLKAADEAPPRIYFQKGPQVTFRGPLRLTIDGVTHHYHQVLHTGELPQPFETLDVPDGGTDAALTLVYPGDCTPPQLLMIARI